MTRARRKEWNHKKKTKERNGTAGLWLKHIDSLWVRDVSPTQVHKSFILPCVLVLTHNWPFVCVLHIMVHVSITFTPASDKRPFSNTDKQHLDWVFNKNWVWQLAWMMHKSSFLKQYDTECCHTMERSINLEETVITPIYSKPPVQEATKIPGSGKTRP